jgi:surface carbohydrate biosynthesis protein
VPELNRLACESGKIGKQSRNPFYEMRGNMTTRKPTLIIPVENQVRELDPKLFLASTAAARGFPCVVGSRREIEFRIDAFPRSIYLSKSMTVRSALFFTVARKLGHEIVTWDEEALVHLPSKIYFSRRLSPLAIRYVSGLFAWGPDNATLWESYAGLPSTTPIHITGNPRADLLRSETRSFYWQEVEEIRKKFGDFILVNTNFNHVNAFYPSMNLFRPAKRPGQRPKFGRAARGMTLEYAEGLRDHKQAVLEDFKKTIPALEREFPHCNIVVRPHPTENQDTYRRIAAQCSHVHVTNEGNVVPWLLATKAVVHNGCTTGLEAYVLGVPAITYRATVNETYDNGFYRVPNLLSHQCFDHEHLRSTLSEILAGRLGPADGDERKVLLRNHLAAMEGPLACERIVDALEQLVEPMALANESGLRERWQRLYITGGLRLVNRYKSYLPGSHNRPEFQRHRYPGVSVSQLRRKLARIQGILGLKGGDLAVEEVFDGVFRIH